MVLYFLSYLKTLKSKTSSGDSPKIIGENENAVRIMSIHKSKGLEFPVVFIAGGGKKFIKRFDNSKFILHNNYGITLDYINFDKNYTIVSPIKEFFLIYFS